MSTHLRWGLIGLISAFVGWPAASANAQLISPGKLSRAHASLTGIRNCTTCHQLGNRGSSDERCLNCHTPLAEQISRQEGLHSTYDEPSCATCHKEHFGEDFDVLRFNQLTFQHPTTGFDLVGAHETLQCRTCHTPPLIQSTSVKAFADEHGGLERTFLGLGTVCVDCHISDDPHFGQFEGEACITCHTEEAWVPAIGFDHNETRYPLTGGHAQVDCAQCHSEAVAPNGDPYMKFAPTDFSSCLSCHVDQHGGAMGADCTECHSTSSWNQVTGSIEGRFDHSSTGFDLMGAHEVAECTACHGNASQRPEGIDISFDRGTRTASYPRPTASDEADCLACHVDHHEGEFAASQSGALCSSCHTDLAWLPTTFDLVRHIDGVEFPLTGAHLATPCVSCHDNAALGQSGLTFSFEATTCRDCHGNPDPHKGQFAQECESCHTTESFRIPDFDHNGTQFPLDGQHRTVACAACHVEEPSSSGGTFTRYLPLGTECTDCHAGD